MELSDKAKRLLAAQKQRYAAGLADRKAKIQAQWEALHDDGMSGSDNLERLTTLVHRLAGSAGSYGYDELSQAAKKFESALHCCELEDVADSAAVYEELRQAFAVALESAQA